MINGYELSDPADVSGERKRVFEKAEQRFGGVPNIVNAFSESPVLAEAMVDLYGMIGKSGLSTVESHVVMQTINVLNECIYCVPAHSTSARAGGVDAQLDDSLRLNQALDDPKLEALRVFTTQLVKQRGHLSNEQFDAFIEAGWTKKTALDVVFLNTVKTLTNYGNHLTGTDLDQKFQAQAWAPAATEALVTDAH